MIGRIPKAFVVGLLIGIIVGLGIATAIPELVRILAGTLGYLVFILLLVLVGVAIVLGQDILERGFAALESVAGKANTGITEREKEEDRLPVNPWGLPNVIRRSREPSEKRVD